MNYEIYGFEKKRLVIIIIAVHLTFYELKKYVIKPMLEFNHLLIYKININQISNFQSNNIYA